MIMKKEDFTHLPNHVAIIMDGNGRWAKKIGKKRAFGHENGTKSVRDCIDQSLRLGIKNLTLYVFSTENWNRPKFEVNALMDLLVYSLENERVNLIENGIKLNVIGELETLKDKAKTKLKSIISETKSNKKLNLNLAISYGSKQEIVNVIREISNKVKKDYREELLNKTSLVLFENKTKIANNYFGRDEYYNSVIVSSNENLVGKIKKIEINKINHNTLFGYISLEKNKEGFAA